MWSEALFFTGHGLYTIFLLDGTGKHQLRFAQRPESWRFPAGGQKNIFLVNITYRRLRGTRRYLATSSEERAIAAQAQKNALFRPEAARTRYLGLRLQEPAISAWAGKNALTERELQKTPYLGAKSKNTLRSQAGCFSTNFVVVALRACVCSTTQRVANVVCRNIFSKLETRAVFTVESGRNSKAKVRWPLALDSLRLFLSKRLSSYKP